HRGDAPRRGPLERVDHHQQFHQVLIHRVAAGLDDEYVCPAHVFQNLKINLAVAEASQRALPQRDVEVPRDFLRQRAVGHPRKQLELLVYQEFPLRTLKNAMERRLNAAISIAARETITLRTSPGDTLPSKAFP